MRAGTGTVGSREITEHVDVEAVRVDGEVADVGCDTDEAAESTAGADQGGGEEDGACDGVAGCGAHVTDKGWLCTASVDEGAGSGGAERVWGRFGIRDGCGCGEGEEGGEG